ncbi:ATP-grasp fold amidoligase family protein [Kandleria vitulina]|uniref:ATP-grasp fold amidoligase family protein n=1 Tax=Kandleria vitulina TaxID=1630 RepID=UPI00048DEA8A|nr:ATP-grasp fold amidoligase family protein [Kandleria vitulina]
MNVFKKLLRLVSDEDYRYLVKSARFDEDYLDDETYLKKVYKALFHRELNLTSPQSFNEKLQWLKLYDRNDKYTMLVDKYLVRDYVAKKIGKEHLIPLIGVWDDPDEIPFELLPTQFVLKCNHNSGYGMYICKDKSKMNVKKVKRALRKGLNQDYYLTCREWPYKNVKRKIVCEQFMGDSLIDYKIQCINGHVDHFMVCYGRTETKLPDFYYFDKDWNFLPYNPYLTELVDFETIKPKHIDEMIRIAEILGKESPAMRVDLYEINDHVYFGEMTLFNHGGFDVELPYEIDLMLGKKLQLPEKKK